MITAPLADSSNDTCVSNANHDTLKDTINRTVDVLDRFVYLVDIYRIIVDSTDEFMCYKVEQHRHFWKSIKYQLNYVNAVYSFKEYVLNCYGKDSTVAQIIKKYYEQANWYTFICNYRNRVIHQSALIKDYDLNSREIFIDLDELIEITRPKLGLRKKNETMINLIDFIQSLYPISIQKKDHHYFQAKLAIYNATIVIKDMANEIFLSLYESELKQCFETLLHQLLKDIHGNYCPTYINNESVENFYINHCFENTAITIMFTLGKDFDITQKLLAFFRNNRYDYFYTQDTNLNTIDAALDVEENMA